MRLAASPLPPRNEAEFGQAICEYARVKRWLAYHTFDSRHSARGFPDWVFARRGRLVLAELKIASTFEAAERLLTPDQVLWRAELEVNSCEYFLWIPADWPEIVRVLE